MIIAIDGPAGSGKSTVAKLVARELGFAYLDTGAMYRAVGWRALELGLELTDEAAVARIAQTEAIEFGYEPGEPLPSKVMIGGRDVTRQIRTPEADKAVTPTSALPAVREALTAQQRVIGRSADTVMEGRDIGTVVFPDAELKVFLTASPEERAARRVKQNVEKGLGAADPAATDYRAILADIVRRDEADSTRATAPLKPAADSVALDTTGLAIDEVTARIVELARERAAHDPAQARA